MIDEEEDMVKIGNKMDEEVTDDKVLDDRNEDKKVGDNEDRDKRVVGEEVRDKCVRTDGDEAVEVPM